MARLSLRISRYTQRVARSMATNRDLRDASSCIWGRYLTSMCTKAWLVDLEPLGGLGNGLVSIPLPLQGPEVGHTVTAEAAIQRRTAETGLDEFPDHDQQVVQGQQQQFTDGHHHLLLGLCQRGAQAMGTGRGILGADALAPLGHRVAVNTVSARQRGVAHRQGRHLDLPSNTRGDTSVGMATFSCGLTEAHEGSRARVRIESTQISAFFSVGYHAQ